MSSHLIVIGASAGGIKSLSELFAQFPKDLNAAVLVVLHISSKADSVLPKILSKHTVLPVLFPRDFQEIQAGTIYIAPPNLHMSLVDGKITLRFGPKINHSRPAIDPLFYSAALFYGPLSIGVILSGLLDDGSAGMLAIKKCHGVTIVQKPEDAEFPYMPANALKTTKIDYSVPISQMGEVIKAILQNQKSAKFDKERWELLEIESKMNFVDSINLESDIHKIAKPSRYSCPACHGVLWKIKDKQLPRYRCLVGHAYSESELVKEFDQNIEHYLWMALRAFEEKQQALLTSYKRDSSYSKEIQNISNKVEVIKKILDD